MQEDAGSWVLRRAEQGADQQRCSPEISPRPCLTRGCAETAEHCRLPRESQLPSRAQAMTEGDYADTTAPEVVPGTRYTPVEC